MRRKSSEASMANRNKIIDEIADRIHKIATANENKNTFSNAAAVEIAQYIVRQVKAMKDPRD